MKSAGALTFGPGGVLLVGDSAGAAVVALDVNDTARHAGTSPIEIAAIDRKIAALLGTTPDDIAINDMAVHAASQHVYLSVSRGRGNNAVPVILRASKTGSLEAVTLANVRHSRASLSDAPAPDAKTPWGANSRGEEVDVASAA